MSIHPLPQPGATTVPRTSTRSISTPAGTAEVTLTVQGAGHPILLLHGGAGPQSVAAFATLLAGTHDAEVLTVTHPGFGGTPRPDHLDGVRSLAELYAALLEDLDLVDVTVVGNSLGGWTAAELGLLGSPRIGSIVLVDAVGLDLPATPVVDFFSLTMDQVADLSYYEPDRYRMDVSALPDSARRLMAGNRAALLAYGGTTMVDATLLGRLPGLSLPTLVVWGVADRVVPPEHAHAYAASVPGAELDLIETAGHLPQLETPDRLAADVWAFADRHATQRSTRA